MCVTLLECRRWTDGDDVRNRRILIDLIKEAKIEENSHPSGRILVLSRFKTMDLYLLQHKLIIFIFV